jgi:hypothetical protein
MCYSFLQLFVETERKDWIVSMKLIDKYFGGLLSRIWHDVFGSPEEINGWEIMSRGKLRLI